MWWWRGANLVSLAFMLAALSLTKIILPRYTRSMAQSSGNGKKLIRIDISSDPVCPWCFIGKKNLDKAIASTKDQFDFEIRWHPFILNPSAPTEGVVKEKFYMDKYGPQSLRIEARTAEVFRTLGFDYDVKGLTGNSLESHRIIDYAGRQALDKQHALVEEICLGYFTKGKYIGDREFLLEAAKKVGIEGAEEFLTDPKNGLQEVYADMEKYSSSVSGVPYYVINGKRKLSGSQQPEVFVRAFQDAAKDN